MDFQIYQLQAMRTAKPMEPADDLMHAALGLNGASVEFVSAADSLVTNGHELQLNHAIDKLGKVLWFVALGCHTLGVSMADVAQGNIDKLRQRYPEKYDDELAYKRMDKA